MNKSLLLLLGVCLTQATLRSEDLADKVFGPGREYVYKYEGEVKSGIPKSSDRFSGLKFECEARLQFKTDKEVLMRLEKIQLKTLRGELESPEERSLKKMTKTTSKEIIHEQKHQDAFRQDHFSSSSAEESGSKSFKTSSSSQESRETPSQEKWEQKGEWAQEETPRQETEQRTSSEEAGRSSSRQSGESSQRSSQSASREVSEEVPEQQLAELRRQLAKPVRVTYDQGRVLSIIAEKDEPQWSINIKRGALNLFQCTRNPKKADMMDADAREETSNVPFDKSPERLFRIIEEGVAGECETQYDIRRENNVEIITKAQNFQGAKCRSRPSITHSLFSGKIMEADIVQHMITTGEITMRLVTDASGKFLVQRAESRGTHSVLAYKEGNGEMETFVKQTLELIEAKTTISEQRIPEPTQPENKGSLVFVFAPEIRSQKSQEEIKEKAMLLCEEISRGLRETVAEETPKRFLELIGELQKMSKEQLKQFCTEKIPKIKASSKEQKAESETRKLIIDAVSMAGTEEALKAVWELLQENKISEGDAQSVIGGLSLSIKRCTAAGVNIMLEIAKCKQALQYPELRKVAWLAVGTMVHKLTQAQPKETTEIIQLKSEYAKQLLHGIQPEKTDEEKMMCIKALGNAGLEDSVDRLAEIINSKTTPTEIRLQAIYALRRIVQKLPHKTRNILYPVFKNPANPAEERIAAFVAIMDAGSDLPVSFLELIAQSTQRETSNQVGNFVYTTLKSCAESRMPRDRIVRHACIRAMRHCRPFNLGIQYSQTSDWQAMSEEMTLGASLKIQTISDKRSVLPRAVTAKINLQALSYSVNFLEFGVRAAGMQTMVDALYRQYEQQKPSMYQLKKKSQETSREYRDSSSTERQRTLRNIEAEKIQSKLNIKTRTPEEPKGQIYVKADGNEIYFHQFRSDLLQKLVREDKLSFPEIEKQLQQGVYLGVVWRNGRAFGSEPRGPEFESCRVTGLTPLGKALYTTFLTPPRCAQTSRTKASLLVDVSEIVATFLGLPMKAELKALAVTRSDIAGKMIVSPSLYRKESSGEEKSISNIEAELTSTHRYMCFSIPPFLTPSLPASLCDFLPP
ncbi:CTD-3088G3.8 [Branchiostoma lanceolatum]|uniref:CTD-3088G3.8 protein n=1 Tax=Branchiostoma lanceolatum TaxID=7740 RepID=A0A8J9YZ01_BRALA|nr:CTD-3088G3.8 [Branchiostoma lanceolatum]